MVRVSGRYFEMNLTDEYVLPRLEVEFKKGLPHRSGIYFILLNECYGNIHNIGYIGEAKDIKIRFHNHHILREYPGEVHSIAWLILPESDSLERRALEKLYIMAYKPPYNKEVDRNE